tara:strand:+ start:42 stop:227 length:186 start_codon:yes stop_codon:yes gene_type:complete
MEKLNVRFDDEIKSELDRLAKELGKTTSYVARQALKSGIGSMRASIEIGKMTVNNLTISQA